MQMYKYNRLEAETHFYVLLACNAILWEIQKKSVLFAAYTLHTNTYTTEYEWI